MKNKIFYDQNFNNYCVYVFSYGKNSLYVDVAAKGRYATLFNKFRNAKKIKVFSILENVTEEKALYTKKLINSLTNLGLSTNRVLNYLKYQSKMKKPVAKINTVMKNNQKKLKQFPDKSVLVILGKSADRNKKVCMMNDLELYERSRFCWKLNNLKREKQKNELDKCKYVFVIYNEHIIEVYKNIYWYKANTTQMFSRRQESSKDRFEFVGKIDTKLSKQYMGKYFKNYTGGGVYKTW